MFKTKSKFLKSKLTKSSIPFDQNLTKTLCYLVLFFDISLYKIHMVKGCEHHNTRFQFKQSTQDFVILERVKSIFKHLRSLRCESNRLRGSPYLQFAARCQQRDHEANRDVILRSLVLSVVQDEREKQIVQIIN